MISHPHRMKGAALVLGACAAGKSGPFRPYGVGTGGDVDERNQAHAEPDDGRTSH
ncbi:hypothetical protein [Streptomyces noursei]|uniref:hypothetical protein n=1 Tax=Streptomyces noursei TaxID=1971 RepID=UPI0013520C5B